MTCSLSLSLCVRDPESGGSSYRNKKRPPESGFSEAFFKVYLLQVLPKTSQSAHRQAAGITTIESWRLWVPACVNEVFMVFTSKLKNTMCRLAATHNAPAFSLGQSRNAKRGKLHIFSGRLHYRVACEQHWFASAVFKLQREDVDSVLERPSNYTKGLPNWLFSRYSFQSDAGEK